MKILVKLYGLLKCTRIPTSLGIGATVFIPSVMNDQGLWSSFITSTPFILSAMGAFALNDYFDYEKDAINKPARAIPSNLLSRKGALLTAVFLLSVATGFAVVISNNWFEMLILFTTIIGVTVYTLVINKMGLIKIFLSAFISIMPLLFSVYRYKYAKEFYLYIFAAYVFLLARELYMDILDRKGDAENGLLTFAAYFDSYSLEKTATLIQIASLGIIMVLSIFVNLPFSFIFNMCICLLFLVGCFFWFSERYKIALRINWLPMLLSLFILIRL